MPPCHRFCTIGLGMGDTEHRKSWSLPGVCSWKAAPKRGGWVENMENGMGLGRKPGDEPIDWRMQISNSLVCIIASDFNCLFSQ